MKSAPPGKGGAHEAGRVPSGNVERQRMTDSANAKAVDAPQWLPPISDAMPAELKVLPRWVLWGKENREGMRIKMPCQPNGRPASSTDPATWSTFEACCAAYERGRNAPKGPTYSGVGFVLDGQPVNGKVLLGIDVDKMTFAMVQIPTLRSLLSATYRESSPSGTGARAFVLADEAITLKLDARDGWPGVEIYTTERYLTVTGQRAAGTIVHEGGRLAPLLKALERHPARALSGRPPIVQPPRSLPSSFADPIFIRPREPASIVLEFSSGIAMHEPAPLPMIESALMHLASVGAIKSEGDWKKVAMAMGRCAHMQPAETESLYLVLDAASQAAGGNYNSAENRRHFDRFVLEAATKDGGDDRTILRLATDAGWRPPTLAVASSPAAIGAGPVGVADLPALSPKREWLHGTDAMRGAVSLVVAPGGRGKSALLIGMALACATGRDLLGGHVFASPGCGLRVLYINNEDGTDEIGRRVRAAMQHHGLGTADCGHLRFAGVDRERLTLLRAERGNAQVDEAGWQALEKLIEHARPDVLILDPLANLSAASLNDNHAATMLMAQLTEMAVRHRIGILVAHHTAKGRDLSSQEAASGAAAIVNSARISLALEPLTEADALKVGVMPGEAWRCFSIGQAKGNLAPPGARRWFKLESVDLGNAQPPIYPNGDSVQVVVPYIPPQGPMAFGAAVLNAALGTIGSASPPLSPQRRAGARYAGPAVARAIAPHLPSLSMVQAEEVAKAVLAALQDAGRIAVKDVPVPKPGGGGANRRPSYVVGQGAPMVAGP